jgi:hypothetical protein
MSRIDDVATRFAYRVTVKPITPPDHDAMAEMAAAIERRLGSQALGFARRQLMAAEGDMITVWAAIVTHLAPAD